jgi:hypothetical protein
MHPFLMMAFQGQTVRRRKRKTNTEKRRKAEARRGRTQMFLLVLLSSSLSSVRHERRVSYQEVSLRTD